jgi:magnesium transporter
MIRYLTTEDKQVLELDHIDRAHWIHIQPPYNKEDLEAFANGLDIPFDFFYDSLDVDERSRYEREDNCILILINTPFLANSSKDNEAFYKTVPIGIIHTENYIITVSSIENPILTKFLESKVKGFNPADKELFTLQIFEQNVIRFLDCLKKLNLRRHLIEEELYNSSRNRELQQLLKIEKSLVYFVNSLSANELLMMKMKRTDLLKIRDKEFHFDLFEDAIIDNSQALEMSNVYTNILSGTMEAYASIVSNNMNAFIQRLTIITIILMVPTLVASFYGMNLEHLPFSKSPYAFYILILISFGLGVLIIWFFRRVSNS